MALALIRRCPACAHASPPSALRCVCGALLAHVDLTPAEALAPPPLAAPVATSDALLCPHPDCAQPNPPEAVRCRYCDRPLGLAASIEWPWGERTPIVGELHIGRAAPSAPALIERLEREFDNVSRRHAVLRVHAGQLTVEDLGSANGTFVDAVRLPPHQPLRLRSGAAVRFAADLVAIVSIGDD